MTEVSPVGSAPAATEPVPASTVVPAEKAEAAPPADATANAATTEDSAQEGDKAAPLRDPVTGQFVMQHPRTEKLVSQIGDLTRTKHDLGRDIARLKAEAATLQKQLQERPEIDPTDFAAQNRFEVQTAIRAEKLNDKVDQIKTLTQEHAAVKQQEIDRQVNDLRSHIPDIDSIYLAPHQGGPQITEAMFEAISRAENGALIAYHLKNNPRDAARIAQADAWTAAVEIGKIAAQVKPAPVRRVSQAPQPVQTVSGAPGNPAPDLASLSFRDYERVMNEKELARRG